MSIFDSRNSSAQAFECISGFHGQFFYDPQNDFRVNYILTKANSGIDASGRNLLEMLSPWREVFDTANVNFEELLQRDLNDARITHKMIPYLINKAGDGSKSLPFFPPILAILAPKNLRGGGIESYYPQPEEISDPSDGQTKSKIKFGDLFYVEHQTNNGLYQPIVEFGFNRLKTSFIIADGQHRAMALLALHRANSGWGGIAQKSYYVQHNNI